MTRTLRASRSTAVVVALALMLSLLITTVTADAQPTDDPLPTIAFLARSDNPVDALAASAVAGQLGGFVALTAPTVLVEPARESLLAADPDLVVIAGGSVAISPEVEIEVRNLLPDAVVRRAAGADRNATAAEIAAFLRETGAGQPLITGGSVAGDADLRGLLSVDDLIVRNGIDVATIDGVIDADTLGGIPAADRRVIPMPVFGAYTDGAVALASGAPIQTGIRLTPNPGEAGRFGLDFVLPPDYTPGAPLTVTLRWYHTATSQMRLQPEGAAYVRSGELVGSTGNDGFSAVGGDVFTSTFQRTDEAVFLVEPPAALEPGDAIMLRWFRTRGDAADTAGVVYIQSAVATW